MGDTSLSEIISILLVIAVPVGAIGVGAFLIVRRMLDRAIDRGSESFESRVLEEFEVIRLRLDRISERLDAGFSSNLKPPPEPPKGLPRGSKEVADSQDAG